MQVPQITTPSSAVLLPNSPPLLAKWLVRNSNFVGISSGTVRKLVRTFGEELPAVLSAGDPEPFLPIMAPDLAAALIATYQEKRDEAETVSWLDQNGFDARLAFKLVRLWGDATIARLKSNPYLMLTFAGWARVDAAALRMGVPSDDERRLVGAVEAAVYRRLDEKHTFTKLDDIIDAICRLLGIPVRVALRTVETAIAHHAVSVDPGGIQPTGAAVMERFLANRIRNLRTAPPGNLLRAAASENEIDRMLAAFESEEGLTFTPEQRAGIRMAIKEPFSVLTGGAGVGKTTTLKAVCTILERMGCQVLPIALAGRAAKRISELTGHSAKTIAACLHALKAGTLKMASDALVIIDEASMLDLPTLYRVMRLMPEHVRFLLVGDSFQLPPIGFGLTFHLWAEAETLPLVRLSQVHRQSEATGIPAVAHSIRQGRVPFLSRYEGLCDGVSFISAPSEQVLELLPGVVSDLGVKNCQIISPLKRGLVGTEAINDYFHALVGPARAPVDTGRLCEGEPIIWTRNDWQRGFMNGSMGFIKTVAPGANTAAVDLDGQETKLGPGDWSFVELAYAITVHKAQGSQFERVVVPITRSRLLDRALLYTAVTRGVRQVVLIGDKNAFNQAVLTTPHSHRREVGSVLHLENDATHEQGCR